LSSTGTQPAPPLPPLLADEPPPLPAVLDDAPPPLPPLLADEPPPLPAVLDDAPLLAAAAGPPPHPAIVTSPPTIVNRQANPKSSFMERRSRVGRGLSIAARRGNRTSLN
jgi:hypothetical protein